MTFYRENESTILRDYLLDPYPASHFQTERARVDIVPAKRFGTMVFVDGELQLAKQDEYLYHEMLVHPVLCAKPDARRVCIMGGGDGCAAREVLKWGHVERVDILDWDEQLVSCFLHHYSHWNEHSLENFRARLEHVDVRSCLGQQRQYDVIIVDLLDPDGSGESTNLWSDICLLVQSWLAPGGTVVFNVGGVAAWKTDVVEGCLQQFRHELVFPDPYECLAYKVFVPSFADEWCFLLVKPRGTPIHLTAAPVNLSYFDEAAWQRSRIWTRDYAGKITAEPVNLTLQAHL